MLASLLGNAWKNTARRDPGHFEVGAADRPFEPFQRLRGATFWFTMPEGGPP